MLQRFKMLQLRRTREQGGSGWAGFVVKLLMAAVLTVRQALKWVNIGALPRARLNQNFVTNSWFYSGPVSLYDGVIRRSRNS